ncbi:MAG: thiamine pyrophosphate-dependent dehydrogenase E1 component subunit alpha [Firmicutes bacterium]|nr:thiamine pyrophosphate-dependent dehydrogenase E1 component subunit alpha [Bacillota bacterium]
MLEFDLWLLYQMMFRSRLFEEAVKKQWENGLISGEMHLGTGEEAIIAGVLCELKDGDAVALDHRGTSAMLLRGVDPVSLLLELFGHPEGLCGGLGGHMHLFSKDHLMASSGIVGSSGPAAAGFALSAQYQNTDNIAVAFFGDGAMNQGMMMESINLASAWGLPVLFVCKDNDLAISTTSSHVTGGNLVDRAKGFGVPGQRVDGYDVKKVWQVSSEVIRRMRSGGGPYFLQAQCVHKDGHFLGDPLLRFHDHPVKEFSKATGPLIKSFTYPKGKNVVNRAKGLSEVFSLILNAKKQRKTKKEPLQLCSFELSSEEYNLEEIKNIIASDIQEAVQKALEINRKGVK